MKRNVFDLFSNGSDPIFVVDLTEDDDCESQPLKKPSPSQSNTTLTHESSNDKSISQSINASLSDYDTKKERSFFSDFGSINLFDSLNNGNSLCNKSKTTSANDSDYSIYNKLDGILDNIKSINETLIDKLYSCDNEIELSGTKYDSVKKYDPTSEKYLSSISSDSCNSIATCLLQSTVKNDSFPDFLNEFSDVWNITNGNDGKLSRSGSCDLFSILEQKYNNTNSNSFTECLSNKSFNNTENTDEEDFHLLKLHLKLPRRLAFSLKEPVVPDEPLYEANASCYPSNIKVDPPFLQSMSKSNSVLTKAKIRLKLDCKKLPKKQFSCKHSLPSIPYNSTTFSNENNMLPLKPLKVVLSKLNFSQEDLERASSGDSKIRPRLMKEIENTSGFVADKRSLGHTREQKALERLIKRISKTESVNTKYPDNVSPSSESADSHVSKYPKGNEALIAGVKDLRWEAKKRGRKRKSDIEFSENNYGKKISFQLQISKTSETCPTKNAAHNIRQKYASRKKGRKRGPKGLKKTIAYQEYRASQSLPHYPSEILPQVMKQSRDVSGRNALHIAASLGRNGSVKHILSEQPHLINERDDDGRTPLHFAVVKQSIKIIYALLKAGAEPNAASLDAGKRPIHEALMSNASLDIIMLLIENGADPWFDLYSGETVFHLTKDLKVRNYLMSFMSPPSNKRLQFDLRMQKTLQVMTLKPKSDENEKFKHYLLASSVAESIGINLNVFLNRYSFVATIYTASFEEIKSRIVLDYGMKDKSISDVFPCDGFSPESNMILIEYNDRARDILNSNRMTVSETEAAWEDEQISANLPAEIDSFEIYPCSSPDSVKTLPMSEPVEPIASLKESKRKENHCVPSKRSKKETPLTEVPSSSKEEINQPVVILKTILEFSKRCTMNIKHLYGIIVNDLKRIKSNKYCQRQRSARLKYDHDCKDLIDSMKKLVSSLQQYCRHIMCYNECVTFLGSEAKKACTKFSAHQNFCSFVDKYNHHITLINVYKDNILDITSYIGCLSWKEMQSDHSFAHFTRRMQYFISALSENKALFLEGEQFVRCQIYILFSNSYELMTQKQIDQIGLVAIPKPIPSYAELNTNSPNISQQSSGHNSRYRGESKRKKYLYNESFSRQNPNSSWPLRMPAQPIFVTRSSSDVQSAAAHILDTFPTVSTDPEIINFQPPSAGPLENRRFPSLIRGRYQKVQSQRSAMNIINSVKQSATNCLSQLQSKRLCSFVPPNNHIVTTISAANTSNSTSVNEQPLAVNVSCTSTSDFTYSKSRSPTFSFPETRFSQPTAKSIPRILIRDNKSAASSIKDQFRAHHITKQVRPTFFQNPNGLQSTARIQPSIVFNPSISSNSSNSRVFDKQDSSKLSSLQDRISKLHEKITTKQNTSTLNAHNNSTKRMVVHDSESRENALRQIMLSKSNSQQINGLMSSGVSVVPKSIISESSDQSSDGLKIITKILPKGDSSLVKSRLNKLPTKYGLNMNISFKPNTNQSIEVIDLDSD